MGLDGKISYNMFIATYINWIIRINYVFWISFIRYFIT